MSFFLRTKNLFFNNTSTKQTIFKNTFWLTIAELITKAVSFVLAIWLARSYGPIIYGQWSFAVSFASFFVIIADFGFSTLTIRELARDKSKTTSYVDNILAMKVILGVLTMVMIGVISMFLGKEQVVIRLIFFIGLYTVINTFASFFQSVFRANEQMQYETAARILQNLCLLGLAALFIWNKMPIHAISYAYGISALLGTMVSVIFVHRYFSRFLFNINWGTCKTILHQSWPFALTGVVASFYLRADTIILSLQKTDQEVGWYNAAYNLVLALGFLPNLIMISLLPKLSRLFIESPLKLKQMYHKSLGLITIISTIIIPLAFFFSNKIIMILYHSAYQESVPALRILLWAEFLTFIDHVFMYMLIAMNKQSLVVKLPAIALVCNILLNLLLIPSLSYIGASIATLVTEVISMILLFYYTQKNINSVLSSRMESNI
jgi:O-antigen/teichoic acid export membrane protein